MKEPTIANDRLVVLYQKAPTIGTRGGFLLLLRHRKTANAFGRARWRFFILSFFCSSGQPSIGIPLIFIIFCISVNGKFMGQKEVAFTFSFYRSYLDIR